jgi:hypothetical protein
MGGKYSIHGELRNRLEEFDIISDRSPKKKVPLGRLLHG